MLGDYWVEAFGIGGPYPALVFSGFLPCADGEGIAYKRYSAGVLLPRAM
jgi:hypothetical protein